MQTRSHNPFTTIHTEGALLPSDLLQRVMENDHDIPGLRPEAYHLSGEKLNEAINRSWNRLQGSWAAFQAARSKLPENDPGTSPTRERWLLPLFQELGYGRLVSSRAIEIGGKSYPISHSWMNVPIHLVGFGISLEKRTAGVAGASRSSPHSLLQEYLNRSPEAQWGLVSNGLSLRILRDNASLTRQAFLEFDLEAMFEGEVYSDFALLWLLCHQSRFDIYDQQRTDGEKGVCYLEQWSKLAQDQGTRALESLRQGVEGAIATLGSGFLRHPTNQKLREDLRSGALTTQLYYRQLLRLVYRLIFLFVAEERELLFDPRSSPEARGRYLRFYSVTRLRGLAERNRGGRHPDLYSTLKLVTDILGGRKDFKVGKTGLGLSALGGFLFADEALPDLESAELENESLLSAIRHLTWIEEGRTHRSVDYKNLGSEELGSIYESLLELHPLVNTDAATFDLTSVSGSERKTTGSYYTPSSLIQVLLDSALEPVIEQAVKKAGDGIEDQQAALLDQKVCDPACGSGHFLVAAAHRLARRLASIRTGEGEPAPEALRSALRQVISNCIYGVDVNPMSVELCKVSLWMEALEPGKPLSFLDAHIQCGDSLVGVAPGLDVSEIPDEAFNPAFGDDKATSSALRKRNKAERGGQMGLDAFVVRDGEDLQAWMAQKAKSVDALPEETIEQVGQKAQSYHEYLGAPQYRRRKQEYDLWTAAFFWKMEAQPGSAGILAPTQEMLRRMRGGETLPQELVRRVEELATRLNFLHWELAFPKAFAGENPGFDCVLGNPPWERIKLQEEEFFAQREPEIANAKNKAARQKLIEALVQTNPTLAIAFKDAKHAADATSKFIRVSGRFMLTAIGDVNTYALFSEHFRALTSPYGRSGIIVPTGIATDDTTKTFFGDLVSNQALTSIVGFENEAFIFPSVHHAFKFCLLTMSGTETKVEKAKFIFLCRYVENLREKLRWFELRPTDLGLINPNTLTMPIFRSRLDAELTRSIYERIPVFQNEVKGENFWEIRFATMFHMANDSGLFMSEGGENYLPLYEGKMFYHFDHRYGTYEGATQANLNVGNLPQIPSDKKQNPNVVSLPRYWVRIDEVEKKLSEWNRSWLFGFRDITNSGVERTSIFSILPKAGVGNTAPLIFLSDSLIRKTPLLLANVNSLVFDYVARQKVAGLHLTYNYLRQLPILPPSLYTPADIDFIAPRVLELVYTAYDLRPFAEDMGNHGEPFRWDEDRRARLRAELDAYYTRLYGLTRDELRYILDPKEVYGEDFPGETFRVLKDKEIRQFGEYRTRRLVLEAWDKLEGVEVKAYDGSQPPVTSEQPVAVEQPAAAPGKSAPKKEPKAVVEDPAQPMLSDFGLYKCGICGKMVMGYAKENHEKDTHRGAKVEWGKVK